jgi:hypothetical protein
VPAPLLALALGRLARQLLALRVSLLLLVLLQARALLALAVALARLLRQQACWASRPARGCLHQRLLRAQRSPRAGTLPPLRLLVAARQCRPAAAPWRCRWPAAW